MAMIPMGHESGLESTTVTHSTIYHSSGSTGSWTLYKKNGLVYFQVPGLMAGTLTNASYNTLSFTVPEGYRPAVVYHMTAINVSGNITEEYGIRIYTDGTIMIYPYNGVSAQQNLSINSGLYVAA